MPSQVATALEAGVALRQSFRLVREGRVARGDRELIEVGTTLARLIGRRRRDSAQVDAAGTTAETSLHCAGLVGIHPVVASAPREGQGLRDDVDINRSEECLLIVTTGNVIVEGVVGITDSGIVERHAIHGLERREPGLRIAVEPVGFVVNDELFPVRAANAANAPVIGGAGTNLVALVSVALVHLEG